MIDVFRGHVLISTTKNESVSTTLFLDMRSLSEVVYLLGTGLKRLKSVITRIYVILRKITECVFL